MQRITDVEEWLKDKQPKKWQVMFRYQEASYQYAVIAEFDDDNAGETE